MPSSLRSVVVGEFVVFPMPSSCIGLKLPMMVMMMVVVLLLVVILWELFVSTIKIVVIYAELED